MSKKILFVEDEQSFQQALTEVLHQEGYEVLQAFDGNEGFQLAQKEKPDLILLDLILPKRDGFETLEALKAEEKTKNIPIIVLTNLEGSQDVERAIEAGATTYLPKPDYTPEDIVRKVRDMLEK